MVIAEKKLQAMDTILRSAGRIVCVCHQNPDGDAIGSVLGLQALLAAAYEHTQVIAYCVDSAPASFSYLPLQKLESTIVAQANDVYVFVDTAAPKLTGIEELHAEIFSKKYLTINIDHHGSNTEYADVNIIDSSAASAAEIVLEIAEKNQWPLPPIVATCLYTGLLTDTGGLLHANTTSDTYRHAALLLRKSADQQAIIQKVFRTARLSTLRLWGKVLEKIHITKEGGAISAVTNSDFKSTGADYTELTGAIDYVNSIPGMRFSLLLSERDGKVKGSLRTLRDDVDVAKMASVFNGGGHTQAAGFAVLGSLSEQTRFQVEPPSKES